MSATVGPRTAGRQAVRDRLTDGSSQQAFISQQKVTKDKKKKLNNSADCSWNSQLDNLCIEAHFRRACVCLFFTPLCESAPVAGLGMN